RLPLAGASAPPDTTRQDRGDASVLHARVGRVMVVDDNRDALETLVEALKQSGIDAFGASTSSEALDLAIRIQPQIAVLDLGLPEMDGFDLARALRSLTSGASLGLVALTGYGRQQDMATARAAGLDVFFAKPVEIATLLEALNRLAPAVAFPAAD